MWGSVVFVLFLESGGYLGSHNVDEVLVGWCLSGCSGWCVFIQDVNDGWVLDCLAQLQVEGRWWDRRWLVRLVTSAGVYSR